MQHNHPILAFSMAGQQLQTWVDASVQELIGHAFESRTIPQKGKRNQRWLRMADDMIMCIAIAVILIVIFIRSAFLNWRKILLELDGKLALYTIIKTFRILT